MTAEIVLKDKLVIVLSDNRRINSTMIVSNAQLVNEYSKKHMVQIMNGIIQYVRYFK